MRICFGCGARFKGHDFACPACGHAPERIAGIPAFAPALSASSDGFRPQYFAELERLEAANFWFRSRNRLIVWAIGRYFPDARSLLEIGCGTGFVLSGVRRSMPGMDLYGSEIQAAGLTFAAERLPSGHFFQMDARRVPFEDEFDLVAAFDVLEHVDDDRTVLRQLSQAVRPGGGLLITVPQHRFLWSQQDEYACHQRRYEAHELRQKVSAAGFDLVRMTSFVSLLLPLMLVARMGKRKPVEEFDGMAELRIARPLNAVFEVAMTLERLLIRAGASLPVGGSLLLIARKH